MGGLYDAKLKTDPAKEDDNPIDQTSPIIDFNEHIQAYDNILLRYENPTYHFKLYTYSANDYKKYQFFDENIALKKTIIAESGVTGRYAIDDVEINSISPGSSATKNGTALKFSMTLVEHRGMYLFDELMALSLKLGYNKYMDLPLIMELSFIGFDKENTTKPVIIPQTTKKWRVHVNKAPGTLNTSGTTYQLEFSSKAYGIDPHTWRLGQPVEIIGGNTIKTYTDAFQKAMNAVATAQYGYTTILFPNDIDENSFYKFHVSPEVANLSALSTTQQDTTTDAALNGSNGGRKFNFIASDTIGTVIDSLLDCATNINDTDQQTIRQFVHVIPFQFYVGFDKFRNKDIHRYEIFVIPYTVADVQGIYEIRNLADSFSMAEKLSTIDPGAEKINMKRYDYSWSGNNTEITDIKLELNAQYSFGANRNIESLIQEANNNGLKKSEAIAQDQIVDTQNLPSLYARNAAIAVNESRTVAEEAEFARNQQKLQAIRDASIVTEGDNDQLNTLTVASEYLEDYSDAFDISTYSTTDDTNNTGNVLMNVPIDYRNLADVSSGSPINNSNINEIKKRGIKSNYYNNSFLTRLDMTVIGDPYWLGDSEPTLLNKLRTYVGQPPTGYETEPQYVMDNLRAEPYLLLNLQPPKEINDNGLIEVYRDQMLSQTVYKVTSITSKFSKGVFTQDLSGHIVKRSINRRK